MATMLCATHPHVDQTHLIAQTQLTAQVAHIDFDRHSAWHTNMLKLGFVTMVTKCNTKPEG